MSFSNIVHDTEYYTSNIATAVNSGGILFIAAIINDKKAGQYCVIHRIDTKTKENKEVARLWSKDSEIMILAEGANPELVNGKYGNVSISISGDDIYIVLEIRYNGINKQRWGILKGKAI